MFEPSKIENGFYAENIAPKNRGTAVSVKDMYSSQAKVFVNDAKVHDTNFAFLSTTLAKLHQTMYEPKYWVTYPSDMDIDVGGGFVDYVEYYQVDWRGMMNEVRNVVSNNANYIPRVNASLTQNKVNVYTFEVAYDLRFVELEKMKKLTLQKSIEEIYKNVITAGWDLFVQKVAYEGINGGTGLFNSAKVMKTTIDNSATTGQGFEGLSDAAVAAFFNGIFEIYLSESNMNISILPDRFLVPTFVGKDLSSRFSMLYTNTLREFIINHNLGVDEGEGKVKISIVSRPALNTMGTAGHGRIVAYKRDKDFVRLDMPYPMQHFITLPNIDKMSYTSAFVGQVSEVQLPYNTDDESLAPVTYWDFTTDNSD